MKNTLKELDEDLKNLEVRILIEHYDKIIKERIKEIFSNKTLIVQDYIDIFAP